MRNRRSCGALWRVATAALLATMLVAAGAHPADAAANSATTTESLVGALDGGAEGGAFVPIDPERALDTRQTGGCIGAADRALTLAGTLGIPADARAVSLNVTVTASEANGFLTVYPAGVGRPTASNLNFARRQTVPNAVTVGVGDDGQIMLHASGNSCPQVIVDVNGYYTAGDTTIAGGFEPLAPVRALDTRQSGGCVGAADRPLVVAGTHGVPADATAVSLNVTVTASKANGFLTVYPAGETRPGSSNLNFARRQTVPNAVTVGVGTNGQIRLHSSGNSCPQVIVDVNGYFTDGDPDQGGFVPVTPTRVFDSRTDLERLEFPGAPDELIDQVRCSGLERLDVNVLDRAGLSLTTEAVYLNVTITQPKANGWTRVSPLGAPRPQVSNLNFARGRTTPNAVNGRVGYRGDLAIHSLGGSCPEVVVDLVGYTRGAAVDVEEYPLASGPIALTTHGSTPWVVLGRSQDGQGPLLDWWSPVDWTAVVAHVDPGSGSVTEVHSHEIDSEEGGIEGFVVDDEHAWLLISSWSTPARLVQIDRTSGDLVAEVTLAGPMHELAVDDDHVWLGSHLSSDLTRLSIDDLDDQVSIDIGWTVSSMEVAAGAVWAGTTGPLVRVDADTLALRNLPFEDVVSMQWTGESFWIVHRDPATDDWPLQRIDPTTDEVLATSGTVDRVSDLAFTGDHLWAVVHSPWDPDSMTEYSGLVRMDPVSGEVTARFHNESRLAAASPGALWADRLVLNVAQLTIETDLLRISD